MPCGFIDIDYSYDRSSGVRVVKEMVLKLVGLCPHWFASCQRRMLQRIRTVLLVIIFFLAVVIEKKLTPLTLEIFVFVNLKCTREKRTENIIRWKKNLCTFIYVKSSLMRHLKVFLSWSQQKNICWSLWCFKIYQVFHRIWICVHLPPSTD